MACCLKGLLGTGLSRDRFRGLFPGIVSGDRFRQPDCILLRIPEKLKTKCVSGSCLPGKYRCSPHYYRLVAFFIGHIFYSALFFRYARDPDGSGKAVIDGSQFVASPWHGFFMALVKRYVPSNFRQCRYCGHEHCCAANSVHGPDPVFWRSVYRFLLGALCGEK